MAHDATTCNPDALKPTKPQAAIVMERRVGRVFVREPADKINMRRRRADKMHLDVRMTTSQLQGNRQGMQDLMKLSQERKYNFHHHCYDCLDFMI
ncbi:MAG TPA: hypothetical protein VIR56_06095 [Solimonas sp.]